MLHNYYALEGPFNEKRHTGERKGVIMAIIRLATAQDAGPIQAIYAPIVREMATSFEQDRPNVRCNVELRRRSGTCRGWCVNTAEPFLGMRMPGTTEHGQRINGLSIPRCIFMLTPGDVGLGMDCMSRCSRSSASSPSSALF